MNASIRPRSHVRTVVLWGLLLVWVSESTITIVRPLADWWTRVWGLHTPDDSLLATALYLTHTLEGAAKGALAVLAVFALRSGSPSVRTALFIPMALVPPLNLAFPFREQGYVLGPTMVGAVLSAILWGSFFLFRERSAQPQPGTDARANRPEPLRDVWFAINAIVLTLAAFLYLFAPAAGMRLTFPFLSGVLDGAASGKPTALALTALAVGTHLTAVATATWIATFYGRRNPIVRAAVAGGSTVHAGLLCFVSLTQLARDAGRDCATSSLLLYAVPLFAGWLIYEAMSYRTVLTRRLRLATTGSH
jgi:hypothetical protein